MAKRIVPSNSSTDDKPGLRINDQIRVPEVRLVGENLEVLSEVAGMEVKGGEVYNTRQVREWATQLQLDMVEISPNAAPPVVRVVDFNKFLYEKKEEGKGNKVKSCQNRH